MSLTLNLLNRRETLRNRDVVPAKLAGKIEPDVYKKSVEYSLENSRFALICKPYDIVLSLVWTFGLYALVFEAAAGTLGLDAEMSVWSTAWREAVICAGISILMSLPDLPIEWYDIFHIEEKFGFNRSTRKLWVVDTLKHFGLQLAISVPVFIVLFGLYHLFPNVWWIIGQLALFTFQLVMTVIYPKLILPLFNKLSPLPEGELRDALLKLADKAGFKANKIEVIDSSKRSGHSNAYFTGFGKWRRIVLFDTLISQLTTEEICAVLAHEIGHSKKGHITKSLILSFFTGFIGLGLVALLLTFPPLFETFGFEFREGLMIVPAFFLFSTIAPLVMFWYRPVSAWISRKHEYEADACAKKLCDGNGEILISALQKINKENLSNFTPHPLFVKFNYSHPTLEQRIEALRK